MRDELINQFAYGRSYGSETGIADKGDQCSLGPHSVRTIMRRASGKKQERFIVDRRGEPKVVIIGFEDSFATSLRNQRSLP